MRQAAAALALGAILGPAGADVLVDQNARRSQAFVLMQAEMTDPEVFFTKYAVPAEVEITANGGHAMVATFGKKILEGAWDNNWTIMLKFPSLEAANTWYYSPGYQNVIPYRKAGTAYGNMVLFEGLPESVLRWNVARYDGVRATVRGPLTLDPTPEYVVTVSTSWQAPRGLFAVSASFDDADLHSSRLSAEVKMPPAYVADGHMTLSVMLVDSAGRTRRLGSVPARGMTADQWQRVEFDVAERGGRHDNDGLDLSHVTSVQFEFSDNQQNAGAAGAIQIRNLKVES
jgi:uncharacterized protein (DUF1330 family)